MRTSKIPQGTFMDICNKDLDSDLYEILNKPRNWTAPDTLSPQAYGNYKVVKEGARWTSRYSDFGIRRNYMHEVADRNRSAQIDMPRYSGKEVIGKTLWATDSQANATNSFHLTYDIFEPEKIIDESKIATIVLIHGVPVNRREWYLAGKLLARFIRVITVDMLGMGDSSKPLNFIDSDGHSNWSWGLHAEIFNNFITYVVGKNKKTIVGANDWGTGINQKLIEAHGKGKVTFNFQGAVLGSMIALNGYWVQHIGALQALSFIPYFDPSEPNKIFSGFLAESVRFAGTYTSLLESMFYKSESGGILHNQYSMAQFQETYVIMAYDDPRRNPATSVYRSHSIRVLAEQASLILGNGELLPFHEKLNLRGINFSCFNLPIKMIWGKYDKMMPEGQVHRFDNMFALINKDRRMRGIKTQLTFNYVVMKEAGHFAASDQPEETADAIIHFVINSIGPELLNYAFLGFNSIARGDEQLVIDDFTDIFLG